jgi:hypothetical protein
LQAPLGIRNSTGAQARPANRLGAVMPPDVDRRQTDENEPRRLATAHER